MSITFVPTYYEWDLRVDDETIYTCGDVIDLFTDADDEPLKIIDKDACESVADLILFGITEEFQQEGKTLDINYDKAKEAITNGLYRHYGEV